jgi:apolipoprotein N-acyltransferase
MSQNRKLSIYFPVFLSALLLGISRLFPATSFFSIVAFVPLFHFFDKQAFNWKQLLNASAIFSITYTAVALQWIALVTGPGVLGMMVLFTIYFMVLFWIIHYIWNRTAYFRLYGFLFAWLSFEFISTLGELRFPWFNVGYAFANFLLQIQVADIGGIYLISLFVILINICLYQLFLRKRQFIFALIGVIVIWIGYGIFRVTTIHLQKQPDRITIMQPSISQTDKWEPQQLVSIIERYDSLTVQAAHKGAKLIIWPEAAIPDYFLNSPELQHIVKKLSEKLNLDIFTGFPDATLAPEDYPTNYLYYNSATLIHSNGKIEEPYKKNILVPVGERMPFLKIFPILWKVQFGQANWEYGKSFAYFQSQGHNFSPLICFEIAFPEFIAHMAHHPVDYLVNITNDAWFYHSRGTYQHASMAKIRAVEIRKQIYRCANTGISTVIDPLGRTLAQTELFAVRNLEAPLYTTDSSSIYLRWGWRTPYLYLFLTLFLFLLARFKRSCKICQLIERRLQQKGKAE